LKVDVNLQHYDHVETLEYIQPLGYKHLLCPFSDLIIDDAVPASTSISYLVGVRGDVNAGNYSDAAAEAYVIKIQ